MSQFSVALLQMSFPGFDGDGAVRKGEAFCRTARDRGADLALFPEMWNIGYTPCPPDPDARRAWQARAIGPDDPFLVNFRRLARELGMAIAITYLEAWPEAPRNAVSIIDRRGDIVLTYAKVHTCDFSMEAACTPGDGFPVATLDLGDRSVIVGAMICFDREFPESARILMLEGAEIILVPNAATMDEHRTRQLATRAFENMVGVALANHAAPGGNGRSVAFDGIAYEVEDGPARDMLVVEAGSGEGVVVAGFDLDRLRRYRERESWGNAFRKPASYRRLIAADVVPPFVRPEARR